MYSRARCSGDVLCLYPRHNSGWVRTQPEVHHHGDGGGLPGLHNIRGGPGPVHQKTHQQNPQPGTYRAFKIPSLSPQRPGSILVIDRGLYVTGHGGRPLGQVGFLRTLQVPPT